MTIFGIFDILINVKMTKLKRRSKIAHQTTNAFFLIWVFLLKIPLQLSIAILVVTNIVHISILKSVGS